MSNDRHYRSIIYQHTDEENPIRHFGDFSDWIWHIMDAILRSHEGLYFGSVSIFDLENRRHVVFWSDFPRIEVNEWYSTREEYPGLESPTQKVADNKRKPGYWKINLSGDKSITLTYEPECDCDGCDESQEIVLGNGAYDFIERLEKMMSCYIPNSTCNAGTEWTHLAATIGAHLPGPEPAVIYVAGIDEEHTKSALSELRCAISEAFSMQVICERDAYRLLPSMINVKPFIKFYSEDTDKKLVDIVQKIFPTEYHSYSSVITNGVPEYIENAISTTDIANWYRCEGDALSDNEGMRMALLKTEMKLSVDIQPPRCSILLAVHRLLLKYEIDKKEIFQGATKKIISEIGICVAEGHDTLCCPVNNSDHWMRRLVRALECHIQFATDNQRDIQVDIIPSELDWMSRDEHCAAVFISVFIKGSTFVKNIMEKPSKKDGDAKSVHDYFNSARENDRLFMISYSKSLDLTSLVSCIPPINEDDQIGAVLGVQLGAGCRFLYQIY